MFTKLRDRLRLMTPMRTWPASSDVWSLHYHRVIAQGDIGALRRLVKLDGDPVTGTVRPKDAVRARAYSELIGRLNATAGHHAQSVELARAFLTDFGPLEAARRTRGTVNEAAATETLEPLLREQWAAGERTGNLAEALGILLERDALILLLTQAIEEGGMVLAEQGRHSASVAVLHQEAARGNRRAANEISWTEKAQRARSKKIRATGASLTGSTPRRAPQPAGPPTSTAAVPTGPAPAHHHLRLWSRSRRLRRQR